ncbi:MAG: hypothetical protein ACTSP1_07350 [Candidatus Freyarchaeota archaeon]
MGKNGFKKTCNMIVLRNSISTIVVDDWNIKGTRVNTWKTMITV